MIESLIDLMGRSFSAEDYLYWTRIQCVAWTCADLAIVFFLIRIANVCRGLVRVRRHRVSYVVLAATALLLPLVALARTGGRIFLLELLITVPHFVLLLYLLTANRETGPRALRVLLGREKRPVGNGTV